MPMHRCRCTYKHLSVYNSRYIGALRPAINKYKSINIKAHKGQFAQLSIIFKLFYSVDLQYMNFMLRARNLL